jgi:hypothetical protein
VLESIRAWRNPTQTPASARRTAHSKGGPEASLVVGGSDDNEQETMASIGAGGSGTAECDVPNGSPAVTGEENGSKGEVSSRSSDPVVDIRLDVAPLLLAGSVVSRPLYEEDDIPLTEEDEAILSGIDANSRTAQAEDADMTTKQAAADGDPDQQFYMGGNGVWNATFLRSMAQQELLQNFEDYTGVFGQEECILELDVLGRAEAYAGQQAIHLI